jgi:cytosine/adenosine deaminase-related metal-dependent hydrolase
VTLVHAARPGDVRLTLVDGRPLYRDGRHTTLDPRRVTEDAVREAVALVQRAGFAGAVA